MTAEDCPSIPLRAGVKAGLCVGPFWAAANLAVEFLANNIDFRAPTHYVADIPIPMIIFWMAGAIGGATILLVVGLFFVKFREHIPGHTMTEKGMCAMLIIWVFTELKITGDILRGTIPYNWTYLIAVMLTIISYTVTGAVLGCLVQKFAK